MSSFKIKHYELTSEKIKNKDEGLTFILLADLHNKEFGENNKELVSAIQREAPDAILVAGDMLIGNTQKPLEPAITLFRKLLKLNIPIYYGNGNHEHRMKVFPEIYGERYDTYTESLKEVGVHLLDSKKEVIELKGTKISIYGFELSQKYYKKFTKEVFKKEILEKDFPVRDPENYEILLAHNPVYFEEYAKWGADLTVSGHLHGGIIRLPFLKGVITPQAKLFPKYDAGHFQIGEKHLVVSPGLGTHTVNIRICNPPELSVIHIK